MTLVSNEQSYVPAHLAIEAMRDNGYKNTAYAVAELIDNSIQADASFVQLICGEREEELATRKTKRINKIAILDNGTGMNEEVLKMALQFGNGTRLGKTNRSGIGRFGMGLPASSISQCKRVDVWSWQDGVENATHIYLDIDEVKKGERQTMPNPVKMDIPQIWHEAGAEFGESGTLVVWSKLDRMMWSKASTLIDNSEALIGRMYRKFINQGITKIQMSAFDIETPYELTIDKYALPNDPIYLMNDTSCPEPFNKEPMFNSFDERTFTINFENEMHDVVVKLSYAKEEARLKPNAGATQYGKHAAKNVGISIVRAGRELDIDQSLVLQYDPTERWWGVEVEFPPSLDELMGVTNNKQSARNFADIMNMVDKDKDLDSLLKSGKSFDQVIAELEEEGDPRAPLLEIAIYIKNQLSCIRALLKQQTSGMKSKERYTSKNNAEQTATDLTNQRKDMGFIGTSDKDEEHSTEEKQTEIEEELVDSGVDEDVAKQLAANTVSNNLKYLFAPSSLESDALFTVRPRGGAINIILNTRHPGYEHLVEVLEDEVENCEQKELAERLNKASEGLRLLLMAWARYEDELPDGLMKENAQNARSDWGRVAKSFLRKY
ncbi:ATP-binding protein [Bacillus sp. ISL-35]|uniref:ATP-binding protein n=1 Tax=Bacillus sp. ISL-35 TaxID=2819122 RepID=UPI001BE6A4D0|nr:ATP-binding protein [Bacillus sp. ISL-35]MBT2679276.1 ATP-binding protein [Bacillus sp. ISL-35]MBT2703172.1 ATP-binding protein [Chryseobacterium sp. ISL-80]